MTGAVFLDRDGVINRKAPDGDYVRSWAQFAFLPGAIDALRELSQRGRGPLIVVTNQRGIARGLMTRDDVDAIHARMREVLGAAGVRLGGIEVCPHEQGTCACRKPEPGLLLQAARRDPSIDLARSAIIGDSMADLEAGHRLGLETFAVGPDHATLVDEAVGRGIVVAASAASLHELVMRGVLDARSAAHR